MTPEAGEWFAQRTSSAKDWPLDHVLSLKAAWEGGSRVSVVVPARDEERTIGNVVGKIRADLVTTGLVDEVVVMDSLSSDRTAAVAREAGALVRSVAEVRPDLGVRRGKGEALWKSLFVTTGDVMVFVDADLTAWGTHFVTGLLGPLMSSPETLLVKGFYDRVLDMGNGVSSQGGRVTELVARPWLALHRPTLSAVVQPLAGEWAIRRDHFASLSVPVGYGVELATLLDTEQRWGLDAIAQVDLGSRAHTHQNLHDLSAMATELLAIADRRRAGHSRESVSLPLPERDRTWRERMVDTRERPPLHAR